MKKIILTLGIITMSLVNFGQFIGNLESSFSHENNSSSYSLGAGLQYLFYYDYHFLPGINFGAAVEFNQENIATAIAFPINLQARYYIIGRHACCGGGYLETNAGIKLMKYTYKGPEQCIPTNINSQIALGIGYRFPMSFDYQFRFGYEKIAGQLASFLGVRFGYTF